MKKKTSNSRILLLVGVAFTTFLLGMALGSSSYVRFLTGSIVTGMSVNDLMDITSENENLQKNLEESQNQLEGLKEENTNLRDSMIEIINMVFSGPGIASETAETTTYLSGGKTSNRGRGSSTSTGIAPENPGPTSSPAPQKPSNPFGQLGTPTVPVVPGQGPQGTPILAPLPPAPAAPETPAEPASPIVPGEA